MRSLLLAGLPAVVLAAGCGGPTASTPPGAKITWAQFQKMPPDDQADPYVLNNLDDDARKRFDDQAKKRKR